MKEKLNQIIDKSEKFFKTDIKYLLKGGFWKITSEIVVLLISLATMIAFSSLLPKKTYGTYQYIQSVIGILTIFTLPGIQTSLIKAIAKKKEGSLKKCIKEKTKWSLLGVLICLLISGWYFLKQNSVLGKAFLIASFLFPITKITDIGFSFWQGKKNFKKYSQYFMLTSILEALSFIPVLFLTDNIILIILSYFLSRSFFKIFIVKKAINEAKNNAIENNVVSFGKHLTLINAINQITNQLDQIIIWHFLGPVQVAIYSFAKMTMQKIRTAIHPGILLLPKLSEKNIKKIKKELITKFFKSFLFFIPFTLIFITILPFAFQIIFPQYTDSVPYTQILSLSFLLIPFSLIKYSLTADNRTKDLYLINVLGNSLKIILFFLLIPSLGIWGIVISILSAQLLDALFSFYLFQKNIN
jgi:O-antigen/teichoic acid export membrane protein